MGRIAISEELDSVVESAVVFVGDSAARAAVNKTTDQVTHPSVLTHIERSDTSKPPSMEHERVSKLYVTAGVCQLQLVGNVPRFASELRRPQHDESSVGFEQAAIAA